ncbi:MAG: glycosyltransferase family 4 protein [Magnetococcales bacterium]|nr:glycosyltransferase family 4 protein [Magnetococcales bacterium]
MNSRKFLRIVHTEASMGWGGQEIRILSESRAMAARGHEVQLLCPAASRIALEGQRAGVSVTLVPIGRKNLAGLWSVRSWLASHPVDVVVTHSSTDSWLVALASQTLARPAPIVRLRHVSTEVPDNLPTRWLYTRASRHIVTTGTSIRDRLITVNRYPEDRITSIPTGIDLERFSPGDRQGARRKLGLPEEDTIIGIVATLRSWKGHRYLLEAFREYRSSCPDGFRSRLVVVGDGPQEERLHRQAKDLGIEDRVSFAGYQRDPVDWLHALDVFALPSYGNEGVPQALMQAMACGLPVVSTPVGSIPEILTTEVNGLLVRPRDSGALTAALERILRDRTLAEELGRNALAVARERFGLERMVADMERLLERVADK